MREKTKQYAIILLILLVIAFIFNLCGFADFINHTIHPDDDTHDDTNDTNEEPEPEPEPEPENSCVNVRYTKTVKGSITTWKAVGTSENTYLEKVEQVTGLTEWYAYWDWNNLGRTSPKFGTRFLLLNYLEGLSSDAISQEQVDWYTCMISTGYGGVF